MSSFLIAALADCRTSPAKTMTGPSDRQRKELIGRLSSRSSPLPSPRATSVAN